MWSLPGVDPLTSLFDVQELAKTIQYEKEVDDALKEPFVQFVCQQVALSAYVIRSELNDLWKALQRLQLDQKVRFHAVLTMRRYSPLADLDSETGHMGKWTIHADSYDGTVLGKVKSG